MNDLNAMNALEVARKRRGMTKLYVPKKISRLTSQETLSLTSNLDVCITLQEKK